MIQVNFLGRLGNNLFQYAFGRILAESMGYALRSPKISYFNNQIDLQGNVIQNFIGIDCVYQYKQLPQMKFMI